MTSAGTTQAPGPQLNGQHASEPGQPGRTLKILFFLRGIQYSRVFENFLRVLLSRGHTLHVVLAVEKRGLTDKTRLFDEFAASYPGFSYEQLEPRNGLWDQVAVALRHFLDYLRYLEPEYANAGPLRQRAKERAPILLRALLAFPFRGRALRRVLGGVVGRIEAAIPIPKHLIKLVESHGPDVALISPLVGLGSIETDHLRAAQQAGVPTVLPVASWDNLSNKGVLRDRPNLTIVWNGVQVEEAVRMHNLPSDRVVAVGAHSFDHWFSAQPSTSREDFAERLGIDPQRPMVLYLGSSFFIAGDETVFVREWLTRLRTHPRLRDAAVVLRPHPYNIVGWSELDVDEPGLTAVWPRTGAVPDDPTRKAEFFDNLYHSSAVVGVNTSAMIEAAILRRPVLSLVSEHFSTQEGTIHFSYIAADGDDRGVVTIAREWDEHLDQLAEAIERPEAYDDRFQRFLGQFIRPGGLQSPAAPAAVDAVERAAEMPAEVHRGSRVLRAILLVLTPIVAVLLPLFRPRTTWRNIVKALRKAVKWIRRRRKDMRRAGKLRAKERQARAKKATQGQKVSMETKAKPEKPPKAEKAPKAEKQPKAEKAPKAEKQPKAEKAPKAEKQPKAEKPRKPADPVLASLRTPEEIEERRRRERAERRRAERKQTVIEALPPTPGLDKLSKDEAAAERKRARAEQKAGRAPAEFASPAATAVVKPKKVKSTAVDKPKKKKKKPVRARSRRFVGKVRKRGRRRWKLTKRAVAAQAYKRYRRTYKRTITRVPSRDEIPALLNARGLVGRGAEIGVKRGGFSEFLLNNWHGSQLISIDPWIEAEWEEYVDRSNVSQDNQNDNYEITRAKLARFGERSEIWRLMSVEAAERLPDGSMDFVYIDARHDYESVLEDLAAWYPKMKPGGIIAGHDYADGMFEQGDFGVKSAVDEFFANLGLHVHGTNGPSPVELFPSWIVEVPSRDESS